MAAVLAVLTLANGWPTSIAWKILIVINAYLAFTLVQAAVRSGRKPGDDGKREALLFEFPARVPSLLIVAALVVAVVAGFGRLYMAERCGVVHTAAETKDQYEAPAQTGESCVAGARVLALATPGDAAYFSAVTLMTVGYGDFVPGRPRTRALVLWEFATGLLLLGGAFPLLVSRVANF